MKKLSFPKSLVILLIALILTISATGMLGTAADISEDYDENSNLELLVLGPRVNYRNITQNGNTILHNNQGNVNSATKVTINVTHTQTIDYLDYVNVSAWFDNGDENNDYNDVSGPNYRWKIVYDNTTGTPSWSLVSSHPNNEVILDSHTVNYQDDLTVNWTVTLLWNYQIKHAQADQGADWGVRDTPNTWNVNWSAVSSQPNAVENVTNEFGVYKYVYVRSSGDATGSGAPGQTVDHSTDESMNTSLEIRSNDRYNVSAMLNATLDTGDLDNNDGSHSIGIGNIAVNTNWGDGIGSYVYFSALNTPVYLNSATPHPAYSSGNWTTFKTYWRIDIPVGQYADTYDTRITYHITMDSEF